MTKTNNRTVLDLSKVQHGTFHYVNQYGMISPHLPHSNTARGARLSMMDLALYHPDYPGETTLERALRLNIVDVWTPVVTFQLTANHNIQYTGEKAKIMWKAFQERIFNKKKK